MFITGPPGNDGVGLPGKQGDKGERGRPGKRMSLEQYPTRNKKILRIEINIK